MKREKGLGDLAYRFLFNGFSAILIAFVIFIAEIDSFRWFFTAAVSAISATALWEYYRLVRKKDLSPATSIGIATAVLYVFAVFFKTQGPHPFWGSVWQNTPEIVLGMGFFACFVYYAAVGKPPITNIATSFLGIVYIGIPFGLIVRIVYFFTFGGLEDPYFQGSWWIIYTIAVTKSADMGAYFVGRRFGKRKLALKLSPNKTLEGALGGLVSSILISLLLNYLGKTFGHVFFNFTYGEALLIGGIIGLVGQIGDLAESLLKRDARVKDSNSIPGVGGILDMVDSLLFAAPVVYIFLRIHYT